jgi:hypothetical protein
MRRLTLAAVAVLGLSLLPRPALAGPVLEFSIGSGAQQNPSSMERVPTNLMLAPGWGFAGILKLELGLAANLADVQSSRFDLELRPMLVVSPPLFPLYLRGITVVQNLLNGPTTAGYGGALGMSFGLFGAGFFMEAGGLARTVTVSTVTGGTSPPTSQNELRWGFEGRAGAYYSF